MWMSCVLLWGTMMALVPMTTTQGNEDEKTNVLRKCHNNEVRDCKTFTTANGFIALDATGSQTQYSFCSFVASDDLLGAKNGYEFEVQLYSTTTSGKAYPGVVFNVQDHKNYDFVYFKTHRAAHATGCIQHGYVDNGKRFYTTEVGCKASPVPNETWFGVKVVSKRKEEYVYVNNVLVSTVTAHYPSRSRAGIITMNGFGNAVYFKGATMV